MPAPASRRLAILFGLLSIAFVAGRWMWEVLDPLHFSTVKTVLYARDALTLGPATVLGLGSVVVWPTGAAPTGDDSRMRLPRLAVPVTAAVVGALGCYLLGRFVLLGVPHVVDEAVYLWQAQLLTGGDLVGVSPPLADATGV